MPGDGNKLNLGSGTMLRDDCVNFDAVEIVRGGRKTDVVGEIKDALKIFGKERFEEILCFHVLEHLFPEDGEKMIRDCYEMLRPGGKLILEAPDVEGIYELWNIKHHIMDTPAKVIRNLYGSNRTGWNDFGWHRWGYTRATAAQLVEKCGFNVVHAGIGMSHGMGKRDFRVEGIKEKDRSLMVSAIVPCCNEYPQIVFTVQSLIESGVDEVVVISNKSTDKTNDYFSKIRHPAVKFCVKDDILSHWQAKNLGIEKSRGGLLFFCDGHVVINKESVEALKELVSQEDVAGHCLIKYMLDPRPLQYHFKPEDFGYRFATAQPKDNKPYRVPVMSTCGMMIRKSAIERFGGWNKELGIYGGGEQYINFKHGVCDYPHYIHPQSVVWHYAEKRGYNYEYNDFVRNQFIAAYCIGDKELLGEVAAKRLEKDRPLVIKKLMDDVAEKCSEDRAFIKAKQKMTYKEFIGKWR